MEFWKFDDDYPLNISLDVSSILVLEIKTRIEYVGFV